MRYINQYTQESTGGNIVYGFQVSRLLADVRELQLRERQVKDLNPLYLDSA